MPEVSAPAEPQDWKWSSAHAHLHGEDDLVVRVKPMTDRVDNWSAYLSDVSEVTNCLN
ncbi:MAG: hypothetical protein PVI97_08270 [Candidatus Thiodiazotropha sp.]